MKKVRSKLRPTEIGVIKTFSLSPDDKIGEIAVECSGCTFYYDNLAELCEEWEDVSEEEVWYLGEEIGNYSMPKKEARKITKKILAWKRLKDKGFRFDGWDLDADDEDVNVLLRSDKYKGNQVYAREEDLDLLFGGENE